MLLLLSDWQVIFRERKEVGASCTLYISLDYGL